MLEKIIEYRIVTMVLTDTFGGQFEKAVNELIKEGYQPYGEVFIILDSRWQQMNQIMVKYNSPF